MRVMLGSVLYKKCVRSWSTNLGRFHATFRKGSAWGGYNPLTAGSLRGRLLTNLELSVRVRHISTTRRVMQAKVGETEVEHNTISSRLTESYEDIEHKLMTRIGNENKDRFRLVLFSSLLFILMAFSLFGSKIKQLMGATAIDVAQETLENEDLKMQTGELAAAVVQNVLNDEEVTANAATFLYKSANEKETQEALLMLTLKVLQHPDSIKELGKLTQKVVEELSTDEKTINDLAILFGTALDDPIVKEACAKMIMVLSEDNDVKEALQNLIVSLANDKHVSEALRGLLTDSTEFVLSDEKVVKESQTFVADVMADEYLQREGGNAIWKSVKYAIRPGVIKIAGVGLITVSFGLIKVLLSPF